MVDHKGTPKEMINKRISYEFLSLTMRTSLIRQSIRMKLPLVKADSTQQCDMKTNQLAENGLEIASRYGSIHLKAVT